MARDLEKSDDEVNAIAGEAAILIVQRCEGDRAAQVPAAMGALMWITRHHSSPDAEIVRVLGEMYAHNPRVANA